jgi:hypothetical protein
MRTFHFKITVRRLMLSVAIAALLLAGHSAGRRWAFCRERAAYYAERERYHLRLADEEGPVSDQITAENLRLASWYNRVGQTFRRAAYRPWETIPHDPPSPESSSRAIDLGDD